MANKIITAVQQLSENVIIENSNNVVCIDTLNNRIGVKTSSPQNEIDVSGIISTHVLKFKNNTNNTTNDIIYDNSFLKFEKSIYISNDISVNNKIDCSLLVTNDLSSIYIDISNANIYYITNNILESSNIIVHDISIIDVLNLNTIDNFSNKLISFSDCSLTAIKSIDCSSITTNNFFGNASFNGSHYTFLSDISFIGNCDFSGNVFIDASLVVSGINDTNTLTVRSDDRLKHNEKNIINGLQIIRQLEPQIYQKTKNFKEPDFSGILNEAYILEAGLIAQDVEKIDDLSFCVTVGNESIPYSLNYNNIFVYGLAALKELDEKIVNNVNLNKTSNLGNIEKFIQNQTIIIESLNNKINYLEKEINILKNKNIK
jgi:hypothetical protein